MSGAADLAPARARAWAAAASVPDPEIPVLTIADLGILRGVEVDGQGRATARVAPTWSGCPATLAIEMGVAAALAGAGFEPTIERSFSPPWTTDWITPEGREKLRAYGIAPPPPASDRHALFAIGTAACPRCGSGDTERLSAFGSTPCKAHWRCLACREPFDAFKCL